MSDLGTMLTRVPHSTPKFPSFTLQRCNKLRLSPEKHQFFKRIFPHIKYIY